MLVHYPLRGSFPALRFVLLDADEAQRNQSLGLPTLRADCLIGIQAPGATVMSPPQAVRPAALVGQVSLAVSPLFLGSVPGRFDFEEFNVQIRLHSRRL